MWLPCHCSHKYIALIFLFIRSLCVYLCMNHHVIDCTKLQHCIYTHNAFTLMRMWASACVDHAEQHTLAFIDTALYLSWCLCWCCCYWKAPSNKYRLLMHFRILDYHIVRWYAWKEMKEYWRKKLKIVANHHQHQHFQRTCSQYTHTLIHIKHIHKYTSYILYWQVLIKKTLLIIHTHSTKPSDYIWMIEAVHFVYWI